MYVYVTARKCRVVELVRPVCMCVSRCCLSVCVGNCMQVYGAGVG